MSLLSPQARGRMQTEPVYTPGSPGADDSCVALRVWVRGARELMEGVGQALLSQAFA